MLGHAQSSQRSREEINSAAVLVKRKHRDKGALLEQGRSYGILVCAHGEPVGWCQYGLAKELKELPRIDNNPKCRKLASASDGKLWRINLFCGSQEISPSWRGGLAGAICNSL